MLSPDELTNTLAAGLLCLLCAAALGWVAVYFRRRCETLSQWPLLLAQLVYVRIIWRTSINRDFPVARDQGAVIVCNHLSPYDPVILHLAVNRPGPVRWMVAREYIQGPFVSRIANALEIIAVGRGGIDTKATKTAIRHAEQGRLVGMFPEGRINLSDELMLPARPGAALVALRAKVPVIPCYIEGPPNSGTLIGPLLMRAKVRVVVGSPIDLSAYQDRKDGRQAQIELTLQMMREIAQLAGRDNFEPQLAGRRWKPKDAED